MCRVDASTVRTQIRFVSADRRRVLVVGASGTLGSALMRRLGAIEHAYRVTGTTHREASISDAVRLLDLEKDLPGWIIDRSFDLVLLCAGITTFQGVHSDPARASRVNVEAQSELARRCVARGAKVLYLSSTAVFSGEMPSPAESGARGPRTQYGAQKALAEDRLLALNPDAKEGAGVCVIRMTKVITCLRDPFKSWLRALASGGTVEAFSDTNVAPISLAYAVEGILRAMRQNASGILHLSCREQVTYVEFAQRLAKRVADRCGVLGQVWPVTSPDHGYRPTCAALNMSQTTRLLALDAPRIDETIDELISEWCARGSE